jgi:multidrug efflux pump subunit AcrA (membrane-fusion protein)
VFSSVITMIITKKRLITISISALILFAVLAGLYITKISTANQVEVKEISVKESFTVSGNVETLRESHLRAPLSGRLIAVTVEEGQIVPEGQVLALFETNEYLAQLMGLRAKRYQAEKNYEKLLAGNRPETIEKARAELNYALKQLTQKQLEYEKLLNDLESFENLYSKNMLAPKEYQAYIKNLDIARNEYQNQLNVIESARSDLNLLRAGSRNEDIQAASGAIAEINASILELQEILDKTRVQAPLTGEVTKKFVSPGEYVVTGDSLFQIYSNESLRIIANIEEEDIPNVTLGDNVLIEPDAYAGHFLKGKVTSIYNKVDETTRLLPVKIIVTENKENLKLLPGMTVGVTFEGHDRNYLAVPPDAINKTGGRYYVTTKDGDKTIQIVEQEGDVVLIKGDLNPGDNVFVK